MNRDIFIKNLTNGKVTMSPAGRNSNELSQEEFEQMYESFFDMIFGIAATDISEVTGYGEFNENHEAVYATCEDYIKDTFNEEREGYWHNWTEMFGTTFLKKEYFEEILGKALSYVKYCEGRRYLVNNNTFFCNMLVDESGTPACGDWVRAGIMDFMMDFAILDLNKPYLLVPEKLYAYAKKNHIEIPDFKERFLCMAYFKGIDTLRWHASIDDLESCESIKKSLDALAERMEKIG